MAVHVDHVYPHALTTRPGWRGPDLNGVWNLVVACAACNLQKTDRLPSGEEVGRLLARNVAILRSPHSLRKSILLAAGGGTGTPAVDQAAFLRGVDRAAHFA